MAASNSTMKSALPGLEELRDDIKATKGKLGQLEQEIFDCTGDVRYSNSEQLEAELSRLRTEKQIYSQDLLNLLQRENNLLEKQQQIGAGEWLGAGARRTLVHRLLES